MIRKIFLCCFWYYSLCISVVQAQQYRSFSPPVEANPYLNPAYAERLPLLHTNSPIWGIFNGRYRILPQLADGPATIFVNGDIYGRPGKGNATLIGGLQFIRFNTDPIFTTHFNTRVAVAIPLKPDKIYLSAGASPGFLQYVFQTGRLLPVFPDDPLLAEALQVRRDFSMGAGVYLSSKLDWPWQNESQYDYWFLGASMPQINLNKTAAQPNWQTSNYYGYFGLRTELRPEFFLEPLVAMRYVKNVPLQMEGVLRLKYTKDPRRTFDTFWVGAGWAGSRQKIAEMYYVEIGGGVPLYDRPFSFRVSYSFSSRSYISAFNSALEFSFSFVPFKDE